MTERPMVAVIAGPTASGKSAMAIMIAEAIMGTIINADASQLYADLHIVSARPAVDDEARVPHRLYGVLDGDDIANAARWAAMARTAIAETLAAGRVPLLVGGTGLYLTTLIDGIAPVPDIDPDVRARVRALSTPDAATALAQEDPPLAARLMAGDQQRLMRGLEVVRSTGRSLLAWQAERQGGIAADHDIRALVVDVPREALRARVEPRLRAMLASGAVAEVSALLARGLDPDRPVLRALGVAEFGAVAAGTLTAEAAIASAATATRRYQKRQLTWARSQAASWIRVADTDSAMAALARRDPPA
ncbi:tRNA dimethylallyltransferase [Polymorphobacter fuscus]|uniref:tRNA (adenosine(37)-N6)-dimethylallyltransferase MiaA n=1 Tax=Sandarakinorhabdus fusca TaxID=1439888 RepID=UPI0016985470|nr:tRNA dimethylallyltransferase [Polymorphobacter fuscus]